MPPPLLWRRSFFLYASKLQGMADLLAEKKSSSTSSGAIAAAVSPAPPSNSTSAMLCLLKLSLMHRQGFKALKQTVKLYYKLRKYKEMMDAYRDILTNIKSAVIRNYSKKCINNIMDFISGSASQNFSLLQVFYQTTLTALEEAKNERLWFKTYLQLCKKWFDVGEYGQMSKILKELHKSCQKVDGTNDQKKWTRLLEVCAIEIQM